MLEDKQIDFMMYDMAKKATNVEAQDALEILNRYN